MTGIIMGVGSYFTWVRQKPGSGKGVPWQGSRGQRPRENLNFDLWKCSQKQLSCTEIACCVNNWPRLSSTNSKHTAPSIDEPKNTIGRNVDPARAGSAGPVPTPLLIVHEPCLAIHVPQNAQSAELLLCVTLLTEEG